MTEEEKEENKNKIIEVKAQIKVLMEQKMEDEKKRKEIKKKASFNSKLLSDNLT